MKASTILLMRHALAHDLKDQHGKRNLTSIGRQQAIAKAKKISQLNDPLTTIYTSPIARAKQTAQEIKDTLFSLMGSNNNKSREISIVEEPRLSPGILPETAHTNSLFQEISDTRPDYRSLYLWVFHNPDIEHLASLLFPNHAEKLIFQPASIAGFSFDEQFATENQFTLDFFWI